MKRQIALLLSLSLAVVITGCSASFDSTRSHWGNSISSDNESSAVVSESAEKVSDAASGGDEVSKGGEIDMVGGQRAYGIEYAVPDSWARRDSSEGITWGPDDDDEVECRLSMEEMLDVDAEAAWSNIGFRMVRLGKGGVEANYLENENMQVDGVNALHVVVEERCQGINGGDPFESYVEGLGFAFSDRCVFLWCSCDLEDAERYAPCFEQIIQSAKPYAFNVEGERARVEKEADLHIATSKFSFDLPTYWLGKVDVVRTERNGEDQIAVYARGEYDAPVLEASAIDNDQVTSGDPGGGTILRLPLSSGEQTVIVHATRYPVFVSGKPEEASYLGVDRAIIEKNIDLQTGGRYSLEDCAAITGDEIKLALYVNDYFEEAIAPSLVES